jgi:microcystin-dependent protein
VTQVFIGQIMMTGFSFPQRSFAQCNGQLLPLAQNQALFALLGTNYGGDGIRTFALPDLRSRVPTGGGFGSNDPAWQPPLTQLGQSAGTETVQLLATQLPMHTHSVNVTSATSDATSLRGGGTLGTTDTATATLYGPLAMPVPLGGGPLSPTGGSAPHPNIQPYTAINFNIALSGVFPTRG